jgi:hypothetical protein
MREKSKSFTNFSAPRQFRLPGQTVGLAGRRAGAVFFARHLDYFIVTLNLQPLPGLVPLHNFTVTLGFAAVYRDWQKTRHRDTDGT